MQVHRVIMYGKGYGKGKGGGGGSGHGKHSWRDRLNDKEEVEYTEAQEAERRAKT